MLEVAISPAEAEQAVAAREALPRLLAGDALDQSIYGTALLGEVLGDARDAGATRLELVVDGAGSVHDAMAAAHGLVLVREVLQLRCTLPPNDSTTLAVRPFRPGTADEQAWLAVNNRAFAWHPDQADWTLADLHARMADPWFDPDGFLVHEHDGRLDGFCWTKVHDDERPPVGEIFVIGVDPDRHGQGLGRGLVLRGLHHLADAGLRVGMLWVEADNAPALTLYEHLGFTRQRAKRYWRLDLGAGEPSSSAEGTP